MSSSDIPRATTLPSRSVRLTRDPLQIPVELDRDEDRALARSLTVTRQVVLSLAVLCSSAFGVWFAGAMVPELRAAAHAHAHQTRATVETAPSAVKVCEP